MLPGTEITLEIYIPDIHTPSSLPATAIVSSNAIEFDNIALYDLSGDLYYIVPAKVDILGSIATYTTISSGNFADVPDDGFNGFRVSFAYFEDNPQVSIRDARLLEAYNTLEMVEGSVFHDGHSVFGNVDGLSFEFGDSAAIVIDVLFTGTNGRDLYSAGEGNDKLRGLKGRDILIGGDGQDTIIGGMGADTLDGGTGNDRLFGGFGPDTFVLGLGSGRDQVMDFSLLDSILVQTGAEAFEDLVLIDRNGKVLVLDGSDVLVLEDVSLSDLNEDQFLFSV